MARLSYVLIGRPCKSQKLVELQGQQPHASGPGGNRTRKFQSKSLVLYLRALFVGSCRWARSPERPAGVEPALPPWQGGRLPLHHGRAERGAGLSKIKSTGRDSNPRRRITGAASSPLDDQCLSCQWDQRDLNHHRSGLRVRCAAASTLVPCRCPPQSARKESNLRPDPHKRPALTVELRAALSGAGGTRTHMSRSKSPVPFQFSHNPVGGSDLSVSTCPASVHPPQW